MAQSIPFGDAYVLQTPKTDRAIALMYQEQKQRQAQQEAANKQLEDTMSKEFSNIRSIDMPVVAQKWDAYKQSRKKVLFDKELQKDAVKYNQANREAQIALSDVYGSINKSKEYKEVGEVNRKTWLTNPDLYEDDFDTNYSQYMNTPINAVGKSGIPLLDEISGKFRYKGSNYNPVKDLDTARGGNTLRSIEVDAGVAPNDTLKNRVEIYKMHPNSPEEYKSSIVASMGKRDAKKYWYNQLAQTSPEEIQRVNDEFNSFSANQLKKFKINKPDLQYHNEDSKAEAVATYLAQKYFLQNQPKFDKSEDRTNEAGKLKAQQDFSAAQQRLREAGANRRAALRAKERMPETFDFLKKGVEVLGSGNSSLANQYFSAWKTQGKLDIKGEQVGFDSIDYTPEGNIRIKYNTPVNKDGVTLGIPQETILNPKDPQLLNKLTGLHQQFLGSDVKVEKSAQKESMNKPIEKTATFKFPNGKTKF